MDNSILEMLSKLISMGHNIQPQQPSQPNPAASFYPQEAQVNSQSNNQNTNTANCMSQLLSAMGGNGEGNNLLPLLMSMMGKGGNPFASIMGQSNKKEEESPSSPSDEILL